MKILKLVIPVILFSSCISSKIKNDLYKENLNGDVRKLIERSYSGLEKFGKIEKDMLLSQPVYEFDENGYFAGNSKNLNDTTLKFDKDNNLIEQTWYQLDGSIADKYIGKYDEKGTLMEEKFYGSDGKLRVKLTYIYDEKGNKIEETYSHFFKSKTTESNENWKYSYEYDESNNIKERRLYVSSSLPFSNEILNGEMHMELIDVSIFSYDGYDRFGNWMNRKEVINGKTIVITEREIYYYE